MSKADEMLEKLGFILNDKCDWHISYIKLIDKYSYCLLAIDLSNKSYCIEDEEGFSEGISIELHQAICEKLKELGWIE